MRRPNSLAQLARYSYRSAAFWFALMLRPSGPAKIGVSRDGMDAVLQRLEAVEKKNHQFEAFLARAPVAAMPAAESAKAGTSTILGGTQELAEEVVDSLETADAQDIANLYSYSVEVALDTKSPVRMVTCLLQLGLLLSIQILYSFGYWDASTLQMGVSTLPAFMDTMDLSLLYSTSVLEGSNLTLVNLLCSLCSLALLALLMKNDNEGTLLTTQPLQLLLLGDGDHVLSETEQRGRMGSPQEEGRGRMRRIGRAALVLGLQTLTLCRALLLPLYAAFGAAGNFAGSSNAQDIVLVRSTQAPKPCAGLECVLSMALCAPCMAVCAPCMAVCARPASVTATPCVCARVPEFRCDWLRLRAR